MFTYVFVYSPSKFRVDGEHPLKRFEPGRTYTDVEPAISTGSEQVIAPGIYGIWSDVDVTSELHAVESRITVDYDLVSTGKDPWPWLTAPSSEARVDEATRARVRGAFPTLRDQDLKGFFITQGI